jgi:choline dehydrogenase
MDEFDYIVIGAGSAGCALAARLSESGHNTVLLLEAGGPDTNPWIHIPVGYGKTFVNETLTWRYSTEPSPGLDGRSIFTPSGRVLGGSSSINGLVYGRGQREDFDNWRQDGNPGWGYEDVLPFFRKSERQQRGANAFHGADGTLGVSDSSDKTPLGKAFIESALAAGYPANDDFNGARQEGFGYFQMTARNGRRNSSAVAFLSGARKRPNLAIRTHAEVERLIVRDRKVTGVSFVMGTTPMQAVARRCVVLSAGGINSPAILQRSGIGRGAWLNEAGIEVVHDLRGVGDNLHDHIQSRLVLRTRRYATLNTQTRNPLHMLAMGLRYALFRTGPLTASGAQAGGFVRSHAGLDRPDVMIMFMPFSSVDYRRGLDSFAAFSISVMLMRPESRGTVRVRSADKHVAPVIQPNYLTEEKDWRTLIDGLRVARRITAAEPLRHEIEREERPGLDVESDDQLLSYIRATAGSVYHPVGTCRMGNGPNAVVDARLRVHGLDGLAVADASIMPSIVSGPTNATSIMIGERAASLILEDG